MFDIGFSELVLIFIVGLVVLGPQKMPIAIRTVMGWIRTVRGLAANVQNELAQELKLQELKESIKKAEELNLSSLSPELSKTVEELKQSAQQMQESLNTAKNDITKLTDEQVAEIQAKISAESEQLNQISENQVAESALQKNTENSPLASENEAKEFSPAEQAEMAELDEEKLSEQLSAYYPPDDEISPATEKEKSNAS
ncbi:Sec-independent protein translocase protein TatB [Actinobacillus minor]|uniref:Sec-independent protein translocase protein TatB n=1 Tax=Actinobacillus minor NM305 TaxID=637911 RepID=C5S152_9PAST|nr:Sec-independent protein translocase protein TatB [Actinobacillus minor]EER47283.1 sec-independent translocase [Actinobacillus minor NM305]MDD6911267.1 Sec-independent protein translocase protein TatB [Actinobacillus minor]MDY4712612.1 Sec-independent protein translocase protein TatB [Actinobacillus minor]